MIEFRTAVDIPVQECRLTYKNAIMVMGSCFAESIGNRLKEGKFQCDINPFGVLYNPLSIQMALRQLIDNKIYSSAELFNYQGCFHSMMHHGDFSSFSEKDCLQKINDRIQYSSSFLRKMDCLILTFGTSWIYTMKDTGQIVANCHKLPDSFFERRRLSVEEIVESMKSIIEDLLPIRPTLKIIMTVSPIRHLKDGLHENQLSKAALLLAIDELVRLYPSHVFYFPSYEILMDELRDYRFYADDMMHPSDLAVEYVWQRFTAVYFSEDTLQLMDRVENIQKLLKHKPFYPQSEKYKLFFEQTLFKVETLIKEHSYIDFQNEIEKCRIQLKQLQS
jgi:hypothetical protein